MSTKVVVCVFLACLYVVTLAADNSLVIASSTNDPKGWMLTFDGRISLFFPEDILAKLYRCLCISTDTCQFTTQLTSVPSNYTVTEVIDFDATVRTNVSLSSYSSYSCNVPAAAVTRIVSCDRLSSQNDGPVSSCYPEFSLSDITNDCQCISIWWVKTGCPAIPQDHLFPCESKVRQDSTTLGAGDLITVPAPGSSGTTVSGEAQRGKGDNSMIAIGGGLGSALLVVIVVIVLYIIWRRQKQDATEKANNDSVTSRSLQVTTNRNVYTKPTYKRSERVSSFTMATEDNYGYTEYVEPGSAYFTIGNDAVSVRDLTGNDLLEQDNAPGRISDEQGNTKGRVGAEINAKVNARVNLETREIDKHMQKPEYMLGTSNVATETIEETGDCQKDAPQLNDQIDAQRNKTSSDEDRQMTRKVYFELEPYESGTEAELGLSVPATYNADSPDFWDTLMKRDSSDSVRYSLQQAVCQTIQTNRGDNVHKNVNIVKDAKDLSNSPTIYSVASTNSEGKGDENGSRDTDGYSLQKDTNSREEMKILRNVYSKLKDGKTAAAIPNDVPATYNVASWEFGGGMDRQDNNLQMNAAVGCEIVPGQDVEHGIRSGKNNMNDTGITYRVETQGPDENLVGEENLGWISHAVAKSTPANVKAEALPKAEPQFHLAETLCDTVSSSLCDQCKPHNSTYFLLEEQKQEDTADTGESVNGEG